MEISAKLKMYPEGGGSHIDSDKEEAWQHSTGSWVMLTPLAPMSVIKILTEADHSHRMPELRTFNNRTPCVTQVVQTVTIPLSLLKCWDYRLYQTHDCSLHF